MSRLEANKKILEILTRYVEVYPDWRFEQICVNLGLSTISFYNESEETLEVIEYGDTLIKYE